MSGGARSRDARGSCARDWCNDGGGGASRLRRTTSAGQSKRTKRIHSGPVSCLAPGVSDPFPHRSMR
ncbi:transmembrane protein 108 isoform X1 [Tachysurus ichikawai]